MILAAASLDDVLAISTYGIFLGIGLSGASTHGHIIFGNASWVPAVVGVMEVVVGIIFGILFGVLVGFWAKLKGC